MLQSVTECNSVLLSVTEYYRILNHWPNSQSSTAWWADPDTPSAGHSCTAQRSLKALFLLLSRALLRILSGALLCHLIMADFTLNITALLWELDWTFEARHIVAFFAFFSAAAFVELKCALLKKFLRVQNISILFFDTLWGIPDICHFFYTSKIFGG